MSVNITKQNFKNLVLASKKPVLLKFYTQQCNSCKILKSIVDDVATEVDGKALVGFVDIEKEDELSKLFKIMSVPTLVVFKNGKIINHRSGLQTKADIINLIGL